MQIHLPICIDLKEPGYYLPAALLTPRVKMRREQAFSRLSKRSRLEASEIDTAGPC